MSYLESLPYARREELVPYLEEEGRKVLAPLLNEEGLEIHSVPAYPGTYLSNVPKDRR